MRVLGILAVALFAILPGAGMAQACGNPDDPMSWNEGFGVARCAERGPRYHTRDFKGEAARGYAGRSDPMVWDDNQWRGTLFDGYARTYDRRYDQRTRPSHAPKVEVRHERRVDIRIVESKTAEPEAKPRGPRLINMRTRSDMRTTPGVLRFGGHDCRGVLVLTWGTLGSKSRCYEADGRIKRPD